MEAFPSALQRARPGATRGGAFGGRGASIMALSNDAISDDLGSTGVTAQTRGSARLGGGATSRRRTPRTAASASLNSSRPRFAQTSEGIAVESGAGVTGKIPGGGAAPDEPGGQRSAEEGGLSVDARASMDETLVKVHTVRIHSIHTSTLNLRHLLLHTLSLIMHENAD